MPSPGESDSAPPTLSSDLPGPPPQIDLVSNFDNQVDEKLALFVDLYESLHLLSIVDILRYNCSFHDRVFFENPRDTGFFLMV